MLSGEVWVAGRFVSNAQNMGVRAASLSTEEDRHRRAGRRGSWRQAPRSCRMRSKLE